MASRLATRLASCRNCLDASAVYRLLCTVVSVSTASIAAPLGGQGVCNGRAKTCFGQARPAMIAML